MSGRAGQTAMPSKPKPIDRRSRRTRRAIQDALTRLILERGYEAITVGGIAARADVGRSTFYAHFRDKDEVLMTAYTDVLDFLADHSAARSPGADDGCRTIPSLALFHHLLDVRPLLGALVRAGKIGALRRVTEEWIGRVLEARASRPEPDGALAPASLLARHLANTLMTTILWWLENGMKETPERMDRIYRELAAPALTTGPNRARSR
jgi:AcrR family transcriptional regulator